MNKIELLRPPKTRGGNWTVVLDDGSEQVVPEGTVAELALYQGQALDDALRETLETESRRRSVRELAGRLLVRKLMGAGLLRQKLEKQGCADEDIDAAIAWAESIGLLDEEKFVRTLGTRGRTKGWSAMRMRAELRQRLVPQELWDLALEELMSPDRAMRLYILKKVKDPNDTKGLERAARTLQMRGFSWPAVRRCVERMRAEPSRYWKEPEDLGPSGMDR